MPELPEVHTTVEGIRAEVLGKKIKDVWSDFHIDTAHGHRNNLKNKEHYRKFIGGVVGTRIVNTERRGKNILIHLSNKSTIVVHMKMTGHLMVGRYSKLKTRLAVGQVQNSKLERWVATEEGPLQDPYNKFIHFVLSLSDGRSLVLSDTRKFASVCLVKTSELPSHTGLAKLGPDPFGISLKEFVSIITKATAFKRTAPIKSILMDQSVIAGIGNIYSDEILFEVSVHPESVGNKVPKDKLGEMYKAMIKILRLSIKKGGDSKSDYRNIYGEKGGFQNFHKVYGKKGKPCTKHGCAGIIQRIVVRGRSSHFCPKHQILYR